MNREFGIKDFAWMLGLGAAACCILLIVTSWQGIPYPRFHDEFSYLLGADTFVQGRLTNPTPPFPEHFESYHILIRPTYMSKYQPGQAMILATGTRLFGHPYWGMVLMSALCASIAYWAVFPFSTRYWAALSGVLYLIVFSIHHYWVRSYWGGVLPLLGSLLVIGSYGWIVRRQHIAALWTFAFGCSILVLTRPFEGFFLGLSVSVAFLLHLWKSRPTWRELVRKWFVPLTVVFGACLTVQMLFNAAVTGSWTRVPYTEHWSQYVTSSPFWFLPPGNPVARENAPDFMKSFQKWEETSLVSGNVTQILGKGIRRIGTIFWVCTKSGNLIFWIGVCSLFVGRRVPMDLVLVSAVALIPVFLSTWELDHYYACSVGALWVLKFEMLSRAECTVTNQGDNRPWQKLAATVLLIALASMIPFAKLVAPNRLPDHPRKEIEQHLDNTTGKHLVFVKWSSQYNPHDEWVFNLADLDQAKILWVRYLSNASNEVLAAHYADRQVWLIEPENDAELRPVSRGSP